MKMFIVSFFVLMSWNFLVIGMDVSFSGEQKEIVASVMSDQSIVVIGGLPAVYAQSSEDSSLITEDEAYAQFFSFFNEHVKLYEWEFSNRYIYIKYSNNQLTLRFHSTASIDFMVRVLSLRFVIHHIDLCNNRNAVKILKSALKAGIGRNLRSINLSGTFALAEQVSAIVRSCPELNTLNLIGCWNGGIDGLIDALIAGAGKKLRAIDLGGTYASVAEIVFIIKNCPQLESLSLNQCYRAAISGLVMALSRGFGTKLRILDLGDAEVYFESVKAIMQLCEKLETLRLVGCKKEGVAGFIAALEAGSGRNLQCIALDYACVNPSQLFQIREHCPHLVDISCVCVKGVDDTNEINRAVQVIQDGIVHKAVAGTASQECSLTSEEYRILRQIFYDDERFFS